MNNLRLECDNKDAKDKVLETDVILAIPFDATCPPSLNLYYD